MKLHFKVYTDYSNYIPIEDDELEKALHAFIKGFPVVFFNGAASRIESIVPDYNATMGWSRGYKLNADDYNEISEAGVDRACKKLFSEKKEKVTYLIKNGQERLIGQNVPVPALDGPKSDHA